MKKLALIGSAVAITGCATIFDGGSKAVSIQTDPVGANFTITNRDGKVISSGTTPHQITLNNGGGYFKKGTYNITVTKPGYEDTTAELSPGLNGWYFGNIIFGGLLGMLIVDPATGAMYELPDNTIIPMKKKEGAELALNTGSTSSPSAANSALADSAKWLYQAEQAAQAGSCTSPSIVSSGPGIELYTTTCNQNTATIRCEFDKCSVQ